MSMTAQLAERPEFVQDVGDYIDFAQTVICHNPQAKPDQQTFSGWRLTLTFEVDQQGHRFLTGSYFDLDINSPHGWEEAEIPESHKHDCQQSLDAFRLELYRMGLPMRLLGGKQKNDARTVFPPSQQKVSPSTVLAGLTLSEDIRHDGPEAMRLYFGVAGKTLANSQTHLTLTVYYRLGGYYAQVGPVKMTDHLMVESPEQNREVQLRAANSFRQQDLAALERAGRAYLAEILADKANNLFAESA